MNLETACGLVVGNIIGIAICWFIFTGIQLARTRRGRVRSKPLLSDASPRDNGAGLEGKPGVERREKKITCPFCYAGIILVGHEMRECRWCKGTGVFHAPLNPTVEGRTAKGQDT